MGIMEEREDCTSFIITISIVCEDEINDKSLEMEQEVLHST
jgi:hypothetical protein